MSRGLTVYNNRHTKIKKGIGERWQIDSEQFLSVIALVEGEDKARPFFAIPTLSTVVTSGQKLGLNCLTDHYNLS